MTTAVCGRMAWLPAVAIRVESRQIPPSPRAAFFLLATSDSPAKMVESGLSSERRCGVTYIDVDPRLISDEFVDELSDLEFREMFSAAFRYARTRDAADEPIAPWLFKYPPRHRINWQGRRLDLWRQDDGLCYLCGEAVSFEDIHIDHVVPLARGGHDVYENLRVTHSACNLRKGAQLLSELDWAV